MSALLILPLFLAVTVFSGCSRKTDGTAFAELAREFALTSLAFSPTTATASGYHTHQGRNLDELIDDYSEESLDRQREFYRTFQQRLEREVDPSKLNPEEQADHAIIKDRIAAELLELDTIQNYRRNPTLYVELAGHALFTPSVLDYAPPETRAKHIMARLERVPALYDQARANLASSPELWTRVAIEENEGNIRLVNDVLRKQNPVELRMEYDRAAQKALAAFLDFGEYLKNDLAGSTADWRLGPDKYARKFHLSLGTDQSPVQVLKDAEADLARVRQEMAITAAQVLSDSAKPARPAGEAGIRKALDLIANEHATPETYVQQARADLEEVTRFVQERGFVRLADQSNLQVIETPEFMRGIYAVGGFMPAPALQPGLGAFYWITPIPREWSPERRESKLREYNRYGLQLLTIHEAMPGHYVQFEYANRVQPEYRRVLRSLYGSGPYVEGWAVYATEAMLDAGYMENSPALRLTYQKQLLRVLANAILDIRLHTMGMTDAEAMDLMVKQTFQEKEEAAAKLQRAKLSSCQLPTYYVGYRDWLRLREHVRRKQGSAHDAAEFHAQALNAGSVPIPALARMLTGEPLSH